MGCETDACVLSTAYNLFSSSVRPIVISNFCWTNGDEKAALKLLERNIGKQNIITY